MVRYDSNAQLNVDKQKSVSIGFAIKCYVGSDLTAKDLSKDSLTEQDCLSGVDTCLTIYDTCKYSYVWFDGFKSLIFGISGTKARTWSCGAPASASTLGCTKTGSTKACFCNIDLCNDENSGTKCI